MKKTAVAAALTALAVPAAAQADRPDDAGERGRATAEQKRAGHDDQRSERSKAKKPRGTQRVGFALKGIGATGLTATDGKLAGPFSLDVTSANKAARKLLELDREAIQGTTPTELPVAADDEAKLRFVGLTDGNADGKIDAADIQPTDRVKVLGKVTRTRTRSGEGEERTTTTTYGPLDIKKIIVKRVTETQETDAE